MFVVFFNQLDILVILETVEMAKIKVNIKQTTVVSWSVISSWWKA